ncbi:hypothetical protein HPB49_014547 [Dermacentor silvarum]|uniref:Uncharacterized protein n=1 Tax=Dermacentor silvarum TaxID=543639 RepID=A0ACB8D646_DERSI|nr:hypothetical protein HPB49_014547 [Dermacentor silvarum]
MSSSDSDLVKEFVHNINGDVVIIPRDNWALKDDAVPRLFPNCPSYLSKPARKRKQPALRRAPPVKVRKRQGDGDVTSLCDDGSNSPVCGAIASLYNELVDLAKTNQKSQGCRRPLTAEASERGFRAERGGSATPREETEKGHIRARGSGGACKLKLI